MEMENICASNQVNENGIFLFYLELVDIQTIQRLQVDSLNKAIFKTNPCKIYSN